MGMSNIGYAQPCPCQDFVPTFVFVLGAIAAAMASFLTRPADT